MPIDKEVETFIVPHVTNLTIDVALKEANCVRSFSLLDLRT